MTRNRMLDVADARSSLERGQVRIPESQSMHLFSFETVL